VPLSQIKETGNKKKKSQIVWKNKLVKKKMTWAKRKNRKNWGKKEKKKKGFVAD